MFAHLMKSLWRRKAKNLMISFEIFLIFLVIFAVVSGIVYNYRLYQTPLGFSYENLWSVTVQGLGRDDAKPDPQLYDNFKRNLQAMPEIEAASFVLFSPYSHSAMRTEVRLPNNGVEARTNVLSMDDDSAKTLGLSVKEGRWFNAADEGAGERLAVINRDLADSLFPGQSALGKLINDTRAGDKPKPMLKVIGVVEQYRYWGEFMPHHGLVMTRFSPLSSARAVEQILLKLKPGTARGFEQKLAQQLKLIRNDMEYKIVQMGDERKSEIHMKSLFFVPPVLISIFLLIMVAFGLFGVLWQNTTKRIPEIGLRRAIGANSGNIYSQIIVEQCLLSSLAMVVGLLIVIQLPITGAMGKFVEWQGFFISAGFSMALIYAMSILCSLYPAWLASRLSPTEALHYE